MRNEKKLVALIGTLGDPHCGAVLLEQLRSRYDVWTISDATPAWSADLLAGATEIASFGEAEAIAPALAAVKAARRLDGVLTWDERCVSATGTCAAALGLPSAGEEAIRACRDKARTRELLTAAQVAQPAFRSCDNEEEAVAFGRALGYPLVIKPRALVGSIGVSLVPNEAQLKRKFKEVATLAQKGFGEVRSGALLEAYLVGPEISVDGIIVAGQYTPLFVARKTVGMAPYFEEVGHAVSSTDPLLDDAQLVDTLRRAHEAIGFRDGATHTELKLSPTGMVVVEINGRIGGDFIPLLALAACGWELGLVTGQVAAGDPVELSRGERSARAAAITFRYPERSVKLGTVTLPEPHDRDGAKGRCVTLGKPGSVVALPPYAYRGRIGCAIAEAGDLDTATALSQELAARITYTAA